jgi:glycerol-3-phosphate acyltransferase PlsX
MTSVVIDTSGGVDSGALEAAAIASLDLDVDILVVGDELEITEHLQGYAYDAERLRVLHAETSVRHGMDMATMMTHLPRSSIAVGLDWVARAQDSVFVSAGPPAAIVNRALRSLPRIRSVSRAALAAVYPTLQHRGPKRAPFALLLDVGATAQCTSDHLVTFAAIGAAYASKISDVERPRVALLTNGADTTNAPPSVSEADRRLRRAEAEFEYVGTIRGDQVMLGGADVIVTDGFTGDVLVRTLEGIATTGEALLKRAQQRYKWRLGMSMLGEGIEQLREFTNWENYGGAPLLGVTSPIVITQSDAGTRAFLNAIRLGAKMLRLDVVDAVARGVTTLRTFEARARKSASSGHDDDA